MKTKCWLCLFLHAAQNTAPSCEYCCLFHLVAHCNPYLLLFTLQQASVPMCVVHSSTLQNMSDRDWCFCLLFDEMSFRENMSVSIRSLTVLRIWRTLEQREHSVLQIMVRGLHQKWKQPVAYIVNCGSTKARGEVLKWDSWCMSECWTAYCCHYL